MSKSERLALLLLWTARFDVGGGQTYTLLLYVTKRLLLTATTVDADGLIAVTVDKAVFPTLRYHDIQILNTQISYAGCGIPTCVETETTWLLWIDAWNTVRIVVFKENDTLAGER